MLGARKGVGGIDSCAVDIFKGYTMSDESSSGWTEREQAELSARAALSRLGYDVEADDDGVKVTSRAGWSIRAKAAKDLLRELVPTR